ncbi:dihydrofolate reductase family protein [Sinomonas atrocyanea]|uniref:dihydrofolate reductase family protein n=1 Tax=Sinomonas atrocyanea TaxID=37927 RepID=UPI0027870D1E|nr:dihydrofolate reductase family protein [Sinomonas atrocyanea]MDQ0260474.1 dihydrofolate reductase [Sinomonas atrocyanea]MDR6621109.1 dihydrofolate reductase [Sinomonas atrocyanea]
MRTLIAWVFFYSLDGLLAEEGTGFWDARFPLPFEPDHLQEQIDLYSSADLHLMGRSAYEGMSANLPGSDHPFSAFMDAAPKVVFSRTLREPSWANTTVVSGDTAEEVRRLREGGDGHVIVWGGVRLWRSLLEEDLIDELHVDLHPYVAGEGTRLFDGDPANYALELVASTPYANGTVQLHYRRPR